MESGSGRNYFPQDQDLEDEEENELEELENEIISTQNTGTRSRTRTRTTGTRGKKRKQREKISNAWEGFTILEKGQGDPPVDGRKGVCISCGTHIAADSERNGTSGLWKHKLACKGKKVKDGQTKLTFNGGDGEGDGTLSSWKFSQKESRLALAEMIVLDELPFRFVEKEGFKKFCARVCPDFKIPGRQTIREDCVKLFAENRDTLRSFLKKKGMGKVSITTDCWTAINNTNFICVTAHFIGPDWNIQKKIIGFRKILGHKGDDIGEAVIEVLKEWDLKNILCCTVDNASANDGAVRYVGRSLDLWNTNMLGGKYLHLRCVAHIINLVVSDGLEEVGASVRRVREVVKWVKSSPMRSHEFYKITANLTSNVEKRLCLDVPTRWNSTYLMLEAAAPYAVGIRVFGSVNQSLVDDMNSKMYKGSPLGMPQEEDWVNVRKMIGYLKIFYEFTLLFSGTSYVTSNLFFKEMTSIFEEISKLENSPSEEMRSMATKMKQKLGKYWLETEDLNPRMNKLVYIAAILDPRQKMDYVETCLAQVYGDDWAVTLVAYLKEIMHEIFDFYKRKQQQALASTPVESASHSQASQTPSPTISTSQPKRGRIIVPKRIPSSAPDFSELTIYFSEPQYVENEEGIDTFDILQWWSKDGEKYRVLSEMARDILAIPISTVASESAFSMGGRVLDQFRSSLTPEMVEALICSSDWLRSSSSFMLDDLEDLPEEEQVKVYQNVIRSVAPGYVGDGAQEANASGVGGTRATSMISPAESVIDLTVGRGAAGATDLDS